MADNKKVLYEFNEDSENGVFMIEVEEAVAESNHDYCDENDMSMVLTGVRHFRH